MVDVILGLQWGDEGKGKIVDYFTPQYDLIARFQGGPNAGHTLYVGPENKKVVLHQIPSGVIHTNTQSIPTCFIHIRGANSFQCGSDLLLAL